MKLVSFVHNGTTRIGALVMRNGAEGIVDFSQADASLPKDMLASGTVFFIRAASVLFCAVLTVDSKQNKITKMRELAIPETLIRLFPGMFMLNMFYAAGFQNGISR